MPATIRKGMPVWATLAAEFFLVVIAVLLALAASQWAEARSEQKLADQSLERIYWEITNNKRILQAVIEVHEADFANFDEKFAAMRALDIQSATPEEIAAVANTSLFMPWNAAWRLAELNGSLSNFDYPIAIQVTGVYSLQNSYIEFGTGYMSVAFDLDYRDEAREEAAKDAMAGALYSFIGLERALLAQYESALLAIEASGNAPDAPDSRD